MNLNESPFAVGFGVAVTGTVTYKVQHTFDDVYATTFNPATATWYDHPVVVSQSANMDGNYAFPVRGVRANITAGTGSVIMTVLQAGV
jgi:hypothetical protein